MAFSYFTNRLETNIYEDQSPYNDLADELAKQDHFNNANIVPIDRDISKYATHVSEAFTFNSYTHNKPLQLMLNHFQRTDINWNLTRIKNEIILDKVSDNTITYFLDEDINYTPIFEPIIDSEHY
ncbi:hypothetical protein RhiirA5_412451 [Rhizophagus irregularis]|uniref:Uncharacterized protein n=1 Tax=Rhizophagus irregularis TaxID=588596 RepID=A0A2I1EVJ9_9GLOM|nr:hypothetical protein RhiirA5_412451 [Rhizophagus irregularis]PKC67249.1 hypothetical protein RhiirA1_510084 [Rhizophagus irregularis]PKY26152.1 hypothetical protein RhiirB3_389324 [Rhizophagus irregularis]CAB4478740.1 unnamed protein product [Rhizophagus irregularis]CAB5365554.1 unnamed protein product [Rhizophagus irregularis]